MTKTLIRSIVRNATFAARRSLVIYPAYDVGFAHPVYGVNNRLYGFAYSDGSFHGLNAPLYSCLLRHTAGQPRREVVAAARAVRSIDRNLRPVLP